MAVRRPPSGGGRDAAADGSAERWPETGGRLWRLMDVSVKRLPETVIVGHAIRPHGLRGEIAVEILSDNPERFAAGAEVLVEDTRGSRRLRVRAARPHRGRLLVSFEGIEDRQGAEAIRGLDLAVPAESVPPAPAGFFYSYELVGCRCRDRLLGDLGEVVAIEEDGGGWMLIVVCGERRIPVPFVRAFLERVDVASGLIELDLPEGLLEACEST